MRRQITKREKKTKKQKKKKKKKIPPKTGKKMVYLRDRQLVLPPQGFQKKNLQT